MARHAEWKEAQSEHASARCVHVFARFVTDLHAPSVIINKIYASEIRRKFAKSGLLVG